MNNQLKIEYIRLIILLTPEKPGESIYLTEALVQTVKNILTADLDLVERLLVRIKTEVKNKKNVKENKAFLNIYKAYTKNKLYFPLIECRYTSFALSLLVYLFH
jgi:hypothetical protein